MTLSPAVSSVSRGGTCALGAVALGALFSFPAYAEPLNLSGSTITVQTTDAPGALAEVIFDNQDRNGPQDEGEHALSGAGLTLSVLFDWDARGSSDRITLTPPEGVICLPECTLDLPERSVGSILLYSLQSVGM